MPLRVAVQKTSVERHAASSFAITVSGAKCIDCRRAFSAADASSSRDASQGPKLPVQTTGSSLLMISPVSPITSESPPPRGGYQRAFRHALERHPAHAHGVRRRGGSEGRRPQAVLRPGVGRTLNPFGQGEGPCRLLQDIKQVRGAARVVEVTGDVRDGLQSRMMVSLPQANRRGRL